MAMIGDVEVTVLDENVGRSNTVTSRKVEDGVITDNVKAEQDSINISGMVGLDGWPALKKLKEYDKEGTLLNYTGRNIYNDVVIKNFDTGHGVNVHGGFTFTCTLVQIDIATTKLISIEAAKEIQSQVKQTTNGGTQRPVVKSRDIDKKNELIGRYSR